MAFLKISDDMEQDEPRDPVAAAEPRAADAETAHPEEVYWEGAKHDVVYGDMSLRRIAEKQGVAESTLRHRIATFGWVRLVGTKRAKPGPKPKRPAAFVGAGPNADRLRRQRIVARLFHVLDHKMKMLEERMANAIAEGAAPQSATDTERDARSLTGFFQVYAKLVALDEAARAKRSREGEGSGQESAMRTSDDADKLRRDLALRLEHLNRAGDA